MIANIHWALSVCLTTTLLVSPFYKGGNWGIKRLSCPRLQSRSEIKSRQSGPEPTVLTFILWNRLLLSTFWGNDASWEPMSSHAPCQSQPKMSPFFIFHHMTLLQEPSVCAPPGWGAPRAAAHLHGRDAAIQALSLVTSPACLLPHVLDENSLKWCLEEIFQNPMEAGSDSVSEAWESIFLTTSQVMLMLLVCGQILRGQELGQHNLLSELSSPGLFLQLIPSTL